MGGMYGCGIKTYSIPKKIASKIFSPFFYFYFFPFFLISLLFVCSLLEIVTMTGRVSDTCSRRSEYDAHMHVYLLTLIETGNSVYVYIPHVRLLRFRGSMCKSRVV